MGLIGYIYQNIMLQVNLNNNLVDGSMRLQQESGQMGNNLTEQQVNNNNKAKAK